MYIILTKKIWTPTRFIAKLLLIMRLTTFILIVGILQVSAAGFAQKITLNEKNTPLAKVFEKISAQSGLDFLAPASILKGSKPVSLSVNNLELKEVLQKLFAGSQFEYKIAEKSIVISRKQPSFLEKLKENIDDVFQTRIDVRGRVLDSLGGPLQGASIRVKRTGKVVNSNATGEFTIPGLEEIDVLQVSYIGYKIQEVKVTTEPMKIWLKASNEKLDEVMVIGYGNTTRRLSTGSTGKVSGEDITKQPVSNPILAMEGRVPGLFITQNAGFSGANVSVVIRGQNSLDFNNAAPLYIIDGVPFESKPIAETSRAKTFSAVGSFSPLNSINPADILSIDVLKDADATAIYGSRGANGVILITTRKGDTGDTQVSFNISHGFGKITNNIELLTTQEYLKLRQQAFDNDHVVATAANAPELKVWDQNAYTNFPDLLIGKTAQQTTAGLSISGGNAYNKFLFGGNLRKESTVFNSKTADKAAQFRMSAQHKSSNNRFTADVAVFYNLDNNTIPNYGLSLTNYGMPPNYPIYKADGTLNWEAGFTNPLAGFNNMKSLKTSNLNANTTLQYNILPGLDLKAMGGYNLINVEGSEINPASAQNPAFDPFPLIFQYTNYVRTYIAEPQLTYKIASGKNKINLLLGGTWQQTETVQPYFIVATFNDIKLVNSLGAQDFLSKSSDYSDYRYASVFGRAEYSWDGRFLLSANIRRDGSSRFGTNNRFGTFGSIAGAWIFSQENFIREQLPWLSFGKLRASYGTIGNDKIAEYAYQANYGASIDYGASTTLAPRRIANPYLQWEKTKKMDIAAEFGFLKDRILFSATYYRGRVSNLLGDISLPDQTGFASYIANLDALIQNKGFEFELNTINMAGDDFRWTSSFNLTIPENKLLKFPDLANSSSYANRYVEGESLNLRTVYRSEGIVDGIARAKDMNGDGVVSEGIFANGKGDQIVYGSNDPKLYGGFNNSFKYKRFQLDVFFQGIKRTATRGDLNFSAYPGLSYNIPKSMLGVGLKPSYTYGTPATDAYSFFTGSDMAVEDASFIRLKNVALSYNVPSSFTKKLGMSSLRIFTQGQNLLTITNYKGLDPETLSTQVPPLKMFTAGISATF
jgi:TonB-linked SusC/RagA family outer membrane protein